MGNEVATQPARCVACMANTARLAIDLKHSRDSGCDLFVPVIPNPEDTAPAMSGHVDYVFDGMDCCKVCKLVRPAEGWTRPCKGPHGLRVGDIVTPAPSPTTAADARERARAMIESWDLQHGYDDIDWRDKLDEIIPQLAAALPAIQSTPTAIEDAAKAAAEEWFDEAHSTFKTNRARIATLAMIITRHMTTVGGGNDAE